MSGVRATTTTRVSDPRHVVKIVACNLYALYLRGHLASRPARISCAVPSLSKATTSHDDVGTLVPRRCPHGMSVLKRVLEVQCCNIVLPDPMDSHHCHDATAMPRHVVGQAGGVRHLVRMR